MSVSLDTLWRFLKGLGLSFKKTIHAAEQDRPDIARRRCWWRKYQTRIEPSRLVFIDETWVRDNMTRLRGWFARGKALLGKVTSGHRKTLTFVAALRLDGLTAPFLIRGPVNRDSFETYVENVLLPTLKPRDVVVMDNLNSHKGKAVCDMIRKAKAHSEEELNTEIAKLLMRIPSKECTNYFRNAGYKSA